jgi:hypothetical protein
MACCFEIRIYIFLNGELQEDLRKLKSFDVWRRILVTYKDKKLNFVSHVERRAYLDRQRRGC